MNPELLRELLARVAGGDVTVADAIERIRHLPFSDVEGARLDHHRELRTGMPEVVFGEGKTAQQIVTISREMVARSGAVLVTRIDAVKAAALMEAVDGMEHHADARIAMRRRVGENGRGAAHVAVISAGTSDQPVAEEAARTLEFLGIEARRYRDLGVSGLHRLLAEREKLLEASAVVVVAGMEGALPSVVGGLVDVPVIAVPTSIGYGASYGGLAALLAMMNSCAPGVTVVNIDNGFGAAVAAAAVLRVASRAI
ncbi:MAG: nickel pincer cofactor biosynthesis protein LarB [Candidatus Binatia bacterium]